jgi:hypothetical protein
LASARWAAARAADGRKVIEAVTAAYLSSWKKEKVALPLARLGALDEAFLASWRGVAAPR